MKGLPVRASDYLKEVRVELQRVSWPSLKEVKGTTIVVLFCVFFFGLYLYVCDYSLGFLMDKLFKAFSAP
ncbi:MAG: preprotein translocase subunit SecE [Acidobacteria bacterium]|nr:preprotein translocase subunit SecE [Acidobacteriota bacterium]MBI3655185.1 preprotein translocase subunit SecE [Acidobacteriota bacterium]